MTSEKKNYKCVQMWVDVCDDCKWMNIWMYSENKMKRNEMKRIQMNYNNNNRKKTCTHIGENKKKKRRRIRRRQWRWDANDRKFQRIIKCRQNEWQWQWRQW